VISVDGTPIAYHRSGTGPAFLLVHGTTADHTRWDPIVSRFEPHFTVYTMDRRGRGASGDAPEYDIVREAEDIAAVVEAMGGPADVLAHSYGAVCALEGALLTDRIRRLVLYEPPIPVGLSQYPPEALARVEALIERSELEAATETFFREVVRMPAPAFEAYRQLPVWKTRVSLAPTIPREMTIDRWYRFDPGRFAHLQVPALLLRGEDSPLFMRKATEVVDAALPDSQVVVLAGQQHIAMDRDPELFVGEVLRFLQE
jgi:pimeloyl-ACP methyl ester carboxylesterase